MKTRRKLITVVTLCMAALIFCIPGTVLTSNSPTPGGGEGDPCEGIDYSNEPCSNEKMVGPVTKAVLIVGLDSENQADAFVFVDGELYVAEINPPPAAFDTADEVMVSRWPYPAQIADQFGVDLGLTGRVVVAEAKDISNFVNEARDDAFQDAGIPFGRYARIISCNIKLSFIVTK